MELRLLDYKGDSTYAEIGDIESIASITITVITGSELATVVYKDYTIERYESSGARLMDYYDCEYTIYRYDADKNLMDDPKFKNRVSSYWYEHY